MTRITFNALTENENDSFTAAASFLAELSALGVLPASNSQDFNDTIGKILQAADKNQSITVNGAVIYFVTAPVDGKIFVYASVDGLDL